MSEAKYTAEECCAGMMNADMVLYEKCLDTPGFALWWNRLGMRARAADAALAACEELGAFHCDMANQYLAMMLGDGSKRSDLSKLNTAVAKARAALALTRDPEQETEEE